MIKQEKAQCVSSFIGTKPDIETWEVYTTNYEKRSLGASVDSNEFVDTLYKYYWL